MTRFLQGALERLQRKKATVYLFAEEQLARAFTKS
jgi:hypothetical protein